MIRFKVVREHIRKPLTSRIPPVQEQFVPIHNTRMKVPRTRSTTHRRHLCPCICIQRTCKETLQKKNGTCSVKRHVQCKENDMGQIFHVGTPPTTKYATSCLLEVIKLTHLFVPIHRIRPVRTGTFHPRPRQDRTGPMVMCPTGVFPSTSMFPDQIQTYRSTTVAHQNHPTVRTTMAGMKHYMFSKIPFQYHHTKKSNQLL
jgi:hypothetical protein